VSFKKKKHDIELSQEEFSKFLEELEEFDTKSLIYLAGTDRFEIIPTIDDDGQVLSKDSLNSIKREVDKLGLTIMYRIDKDNGETIVLCAATLRCMVFVEGMQ